MKNIIAFAGSNSLKSINKQLAIYAASLVEDAEITILDLNDFELPLFGVDLEKQIGAPDNVRKFLDYIRNSDGIILSLAEHNGAYSAAFKNLFDWLSRSEKKTFMGKPILLMATSGGGRGGASVLAMAHSRFPYHDAKIAAEFSLPLFADKFADGKITDSEFDDELKEAVKLFQKQL
ncbi:NADPH-dependent FMN reductase [Gelidibacter mesophilus]|uniref:NADPH-dependent FMN reductase n=1 Tax=Gelidibacter mesophilus TaxID=169050 RepID=UPI00040CAA1E|nr:NAD(P)H-dependent oxidoreductase [Gelidibacter mesophilus]